MTENLTDDELIAQFHTMWDGFPGIARLVAKDHSIMAANKIAIDKGFAPYLKCITVGDAELHRGCKMSAALHTGEAQIDELLPGRIRGWAPVRGRSDVLVHFTVTVSE